MTILHSITSSRTPDRHASVTDCWPSHTRHTPDDILINGASLATAARTGHTPLVRIGETARSVARSHHQQVFVTVVVTRIEHVDHLGILQRPDVWIDAALGSCHPIVGSARIIGRSTTGRLKKVHIRVENAPGHHLTIMLPADLRDGDLLVIACVGIVPLSHVAPRTGQPRTAVLESIEDDADQHGFYGSCGK